MPHFWFGVIYTFSCPICGEAGEERTGLYATTNDPTKVESEIGRRTLNCRACTSAVPGDTEVEIEVRTGTMKQLRKLGFPFPRNN